MASTTFTLYARPTWAVPASAGRQTTLTAYVPARIVSGLYSSSLTTSARKKNWRPHALTPLVDKNGLITTEWGRFFGDLAVRKLGGAIYPTVPDLAQFVTKTQVDAQLAHAQDQMAAANAASIAAILEVIKTAGLTGAAQVPAPVLARQETNPQPISFDNSSSGAGAGGDGGDGG